VFDLGIAAESVMTLVVRVNGKLRDRLTVPVGTGEEQLRERALVSEKVRAAMNGKPVRKVIAVPDRLVNIVA
jgi:leucyl-tRNA synthetase